LQVLGQVVVELGFESLAHSFRRGRAANPALAGVGIAMLGAATGLVASLLLPRRVLPRSPVPRLGVLVSPLLAWGIIEGARGLGASPGRRSDPPGDLLGRGTLRVRGGGGPVVDGGSQLLGSRDAQQEVP